MEWVLFTEDLLYLVLPLNMITFEFTDLHTCQVSSAKCGAA